MENRDKKVGIVYSKEFLKHKLHNYHPEKPERISFVMDYLKTTGTLSKLKELSFTPVDEKWLVTIHSRDYIDFVKKSCQSGSVVLDSVDTYINQDSFEIAKLAVGGCVKAADEVISGELESCFCCVRPPGHHAEYDRAMGFCVFNNVAIVAKYLQKQHKIEKIAIIDWDVHHGNGTQNSFYEDSSVFYFSTHQYPFYPGTGTEKEKGENSGTGFTLNIPLLTACTDQEFESEFKTKFVPVMEKFKPEILLISAGFDAHSSDPLSSMKMTENGFGNLTRILKLVAGEYCENRIISILEGGYNLKALATSIEQHIQVLLQE